jgi:alpha-galactosidase
MIGATFERVRTPSGETLRLRGDRLELRWEADGQLILVEPSGTGSRVAGGLLLELAPRAQQRLDETGVVRFAAAQQQSDPVAVADAQGAGLCVTRRYTTEPDSIAVAADLCLYDATIGAVFRLTLQNVGAQPIVIQRAFPFVSGTWWRAHSLALAGRTREFSVYKNGWQSWSYAGGLPLGKGDPRPRTRTMVAWHSPGGVHPQRPHGGRVDVVSEGLGMLGAPTLPVALFAGFLGAERWLSQVYAARREGAFAAVILLDGYALQPGEELILPALWLALGPQGELPTAYAEAVAREQGARSSRHVPTGWCSWYFYYTGVSEDHIVENLTSIRAMGRSLPVDLVQIDDGYQSAIGDWLSVNATFPHGMAYLAARIREAGFRPGIWLAPFTVAANSVLAHAHPEWLVQDVDGKPRFAGHNWDTDLHALDTSHPGARDWLRRIFGTLVGEWGYDYLKLDFLACAALPGIRHNPEATRASALRDGLALIRETVGDEAYILGCGCPLLSAVGLVDAMRIGPDSAPHWNPRYEGLPVPFGEGHALPTMEGALRNTLTRAWMHPALWTNDPDCLLVREQRSELTLDEVRAFASAVGLTGGMVILSDRLPELSPERLEIIAKLLPPLPTRALPTEYFDSGIPRRVALHLRGAPGDVWLVGLFNGDAGDREDVLTWSELGLAPGAYHAAEFWSGTYLGSSSSGVTLRLAPHGAAVLALRLATGEPTLLSSSFHISQGALDVTAWTFDQECGEVRWRSTLGRAAHGSFSLWLPQGMAPRRVTSSAGSASWRREATGEVVVAAEVPGTAALTLELE